SSWVASRMSSAVFEAAVVAPRMPRQTIGRSPLAVIRSVSPFLSWHIDPRRSVAGCNRQGLDVTGVCADQGPHCPNRALRLTQSYQQAPGCLRAGEALDHLPLGAESSGNASTTFSDSSVR